MVFKLMGCHFGTPEKEPFSEPLFGPASMSPNCGGTSFQDKNQVHIPDPFWGPPSVEGSSGRRRPDFMQLQLYAPLLDLFRRLFLGLLLELLLVLLLACLLDFFLEPAAHTEVQEDAPLPLFSCEQW